jgi:hypothetical protein
MLVFASSVSRCDNIGEINNIHTDSTSSIRGNIDLAGSNDSDLVHPEKLVRLSSTLISLKYIIHIT